MRIAYVKSVPASSRRTRSVPPMIDIGLARAKPRWVLAQTISWPVGWRATAPSSAPSSFFDLKRSASAARRPVIAALPATAPGMPGHCQEDWSLYSGSGSSVIPAGTSWGLLPADSTASPSGPESRMKRLAVLTPS